MTFMTISIQLIIFLLFLRTLQENTKELKEEKVPFFEIKKINQNTTVIFLLIEILLVLVLANHDAIAETIGHILDTLHIGQ